MLNLLAACVFASQSVMTCASSAPMPTHEVHDGVVVILGSSEPAVAQQNATDQTILDNQARAQSQAYLDSLVQANVALTRAILNGR